jgi:hypothetical protein
VGAAVAGGVAVNLGDPIGAIGRWNAAAPAGMLVPEAAADVDDLPQAGKDQIGRAGERTDVVG